MNIPHLSDQRVAELLDYPAVLAELDAAFADLAEGRAVVHGRQRSACGDIKLSTMGALWPARGVGGVKVYPTVAGRFSFLVTLFNLHDNRPLAVLDGNELTRWRTAAISALVARRAARPGARKLALFGAGWQGRAQAECLCEALALREVAVVDPQADARWCEQLRHRHDLEVHACDAREALRGADIVVTATRSATPVFDGDWLMSGSLVSAIGSSSPTVRELDDRSLQRAARIVVEWLPQSRVEAGELVLWRQGRDLDTCVDLPQLYRGEQPWRADERDIIVFKSVGVGLSDVAAAHLAWQRSSA